jgi:hypothetical protein
MYCKKLCKKNGRVIRSYDTIICVMAIILIKCSVTPPSQGQFSLTRGGQAKGELSDGGAV